MMASNKEIFGWTVAAIMLFFIIELFLIEACGPLHDKETFFFSSILFIMLCGISFVICNVVYRRLREPRKQLPRIMDQRSPLTDRRVPEDAQTGPKIISITDRYGREYRVPPHVSPSPPHIGGREPVLQGIDYSQSECIVDLNPADFFCQKCGSTLCSSCAEKTGYMCPKCQTQLIPVRRPI